MTSTEQPRVGGEYEHRGGEVLRASRKMFALITFLLAGVFVFCHGCHSGDHDDELVVHWLDHER